MLTRQTPPALRTWLATYASPFADELTLGGVAQECHRLYLAGHISPALTQQLVIDWAAHKLATCPDFTADHWGWISSTDEIGMDKWHLRLCRTLSPVTAAASSTWRAREGDLPGHLQRIGDLARNLLPLVEEVSLLNINLEQVASKNPAMLPLLRQSCHLRDKEFSDRRSRRRGIDRGASVPDLVTAELRTLKDAYRAPRLSDFLRVLIEVASNAPQRAPLTGRKGVDDLLEGLSDADRDLLARNFGLPFDTKRALDELDSGGDFGKYPARNDAVRHAVIRAFPAALLDRSDEPPKVTLASVIEQACIAWFGSAPAIADINAAIKPGRRELERSMRARIRRRKEGIEAVGHEDGTEAL